MYGVAVISLVGTSMRVVNCFSEMQNLRHSSRITFRPRSDEDLGLQSRKVIGARSNAGPCCAENRDKKELGYMKKKEVEFLLSE